MRTLIAELKDYTLNNSEEVIILVNIGVVLSTIIIVITSV